MLSHTKLGLFPNVVSLVVPRLFLDLVYDNGVILP